MTVCMGASLPKYGGVITVGLEETPQTLDPIFATTRQEVQMVLLMHRGLIGPPSRTGDPLPGLACRWEASPDRRSWRFFLREDARFWDGTAVRAEDVRRSFSRLLRAGEESPWIWLLKPIRGGSQDRLEGLVVEEERVLRIDLVDPDPDFIAFLGQPALSVIQDSGDEIQGAGPFFLSHSHLGEWRLEACRPGALGPYVEGVRFLHIPEPESRRLEFELAGLDFLFLETADTLRMSTDVRWKRWLHVPSTAWRQLLLVPHGGNPLWATESGRHLLRSALDTKEFRDVLFNPLAETCVSLLPAEIVALPPTSTRPSFDVEPLRSSSRPRPASELRLWAPAESSDMHRLAERVQAQLMDAGLNVSLTRTGWDKMRSGWQEGRYDLALIDLSRWAWLPYDSHSGLIRMETLMRAEWALAMRSKDLEEAREFLDRAWATSDSAHRRRLCMEADLVLRIKAGWLPLVALKTPMAAGPNAHGIRFLGNGLVNMDHAWVQEHNVEVAQERERSKPVRSVDFQADGW